MIHKLHHNLREPVRSVNIVLSLLGNSLLSTVKMVKASYMAIYDKKEVNFYNSTTTKITVLVEPSSKGDDAHRPNCGMYTWWTMSGMKIQTPFSLIIHTNMTV
jgi:hypothetical protein